MYFINPGSPDGNLKYLIDAEKAHLNMQNEKHIKGLDMKAYDSFCVKNNIEHSISSYQKYLNQEQNHSKAQVLGKFSTLLKLDYSENLFLQLMNSSFDDTQKIQELFPLLEKDVTKKNGKKLINSRENAKMQAMSGVFSAPKSLSILYAMSQNDLKFQKKIRDIFLEANKEAIKLMEKNAVPAHYDELKQDPRYKNLKLDRSKTCLSAFAFTHYENRGYIDENGKRQLEPHLHIHNEYANFAVFEFIVTDDNGNPIMEKDKNGKMVEKRIQKILAPDFVNAYKKQVEISSIVDTILMSKLNAAGIKTELTYTEQGKETFQIAGISREQELMFSKRGDQCKKWIEEELAKGKSYADGEAAYNNMRELSGRATKLAKEDHDANSIHQIIFNYTTQKLGKEAIIKIKSAQSHDQKYHECKFEEILECDQLRLQGEISETQLRQLVVDHIRFNREFKDIDDIENEIDKVILELIEKNLLIRKKDNNFTSLKIALLEVELDKQLRDIALDNKKIDDESYSKNLKELEIFQEKIKSNGFELEAAQIAACNLVAEDRKFYFIQGWAGAGKTTTAIKFTKDLNKSKNRKVMGLAVQNTTSKALTDAGFENEDCQNTTKFLLDAYDKNTHNIKESFIKEQQNALWVIDEASMIGLEQGSKLIELAKKCNASICLVGDTEQILSVECGDFIHQVQRLINDDAQIELDTVVRQRTAAQRDLAKLFRQGQIKIALKALSKFGDLHEFGEIHEAKSALAKMYVQDKETSKICLCATNKDVDEMNLLIKQYLLDSKDPSIDWKKQFSVTTKKKKGKGEIVKNSFFNVGDKIIFTAGFKEDKLKFYNSQTAKILSFTTNKKGEVIVTIETNGKIVTFNATKHNQFQLSYAMTKNKSQGLSVENAYVLAHIGTNKNDEYVKFSRHKNKVKMFMTSEQRKNYILNASKSQFKIVNMEDDNVKRVVEKEMIRLKNSKIVTNIQSFIKDKIIRQNVKDKDRVRHIETLNKIDNKNNLSTKTTDLNSLNNIHAQKLKQIQKKQIQIFNEKNKSSDDYLKNINEQLDQIAKNLTDDDNDGSGSNSSGGHLGVMPKIPHRPDLPKPKKPTKK